MLRIINNTGQGSIAPRPSVFHCFQRLLREHRVCRDRHALRGNLGPGRFEDFIRVGKIVGFGDGEFARIVSVGAVTEQHRLAVL